MSNTKRIIQTFAVIDAHDISGSITGDETNTSWVDTVVYEVAFTGANPLGTLQFEAVLRSKGTDGLDADQWKLVDFGTTGTSIAITGAVAHTFIFSPCVFQKIRPKYTTASSSAGLLTVVVSGKEG
jgi:hypothetical protein